MIKLQRWVWLNSSSGLCHWAHLRRWSMLMRWSHMRFLQEHCYWTSCWWLENTERIILEWVLGMSLLFIKAFRVLGIVWQGQGLTGFLRSRLYWLRLFHRQFCKSNSKTWIQEEVEYVWFLHHQISQPFLRIYSVISIVFTGLDYQSNGVTSQHFPTHPQTHKLGSKHQLLCLAPSKAG